MGWHRHAKGVHKGFQSGGLVGGDVLAGQDDPSMRKLIEQLLKTDPNLMNVATAEPALPPEERRTASGSESSSGGFAKGGKVGRVIRRKR
jgi:hypothetical protein